MSVARMHPARRHLVGVVVGVREVAGEDLQAPARDRAGEVEARVAVYASRTAAAALAEILVYWPSAGAFKPTLGTRLAVTLEPIE